MTEMSEACQAALPVPVHDYTGRMRGDNPVITGTGPFRLEWVECGRPATAVHLYRCEHGHEKTGATCREHAPQPGQVGCRACFGEGHLCDMRIGSVTVPEPENEHSLDLRE